ncbi:hypothetical protein MHYP_G00216670 [Metynnis hypsauchen]
MILNYFRAIIRKSPLEAFVLFSFILLVVEKLVERGFVCPCIHGQNITLCIFYALVPGLASSAFTYCTLVPDPHRNNGEQKRKRIGYSIGSFFIWLALFFLDGRYIACASSYWEGIYHMDLVPWCVSTGADRLSTDYRLKTQTYFFASEVTGFVLLTAIIVVTLICHCRQSGQGNTEEISGNMEGPVMAT